MNRTLAVDLIRKKLKSGSPSIGSWMQIPHASVAEIMGSAGYDWVAVDLEHGAMSLHQLPELFRALELGNTLPLARIAQGQPEHCKQALDAGAGGIIVPMIESGSHLIEVRDACRWPPSGSRGVGFSRANLYGKNFENYRKEAQNPLLIAMIENAQAITNLDQILGVDGLDAILIGPYDLSASLGITAEFDHPVFSSAMDKITNLSKLKGVASGVHVVSPSPSQLKQRLSEGHQFVAYSIDAVMLNDMVECPQIFDDKRS